MSLELPIKGDNNIECPHCKQITTIKYRIEDLEHVSSNERKMGTEYQYEAKLDFDCYMCNRKFEATIDVWEYPEGALNLVQVDKKSIAKLK